MKKVSAVISVVMACAVAVGVTSTSQRRLVSSRTLQRTALRVRKRKLLWSLKCLLTLES